MRRTVIASVLVGSLLVLLVGLAAAQAKKPDATLTLSEGSVAVGIGFSWGKGTLSYQGKTYPSAAATRPEPRKERSVGGAGVSTMKNQNGVVIELKSTTQGANLKLAAEGIKLTLDQK